MAATYQGIGTLQTSGAGGSLTVPWPTHQTNDIGLLIWVTDTVSAVTWPPSGWTGITNQQNNGGSDPVSTYVAYKRAASGSESSVTVGANGGTNHGAVILTVRGGVTSGDPVGSANTGATETMSSSGWDTGTSSVSFNANGCDVLVYGFKGTSDAPTVTSWSFTGTGAPTPTERLDSTISGNWTMAIATGDHGSTATATEAGSVYCSSSAYNAALIFLQVQPAPVDAGGKFFAFF